MRKLILPLLAVVALLASSCVRSKVLVTSEPSGAEVTMNGVSLGQTPLEQPFTWYWYYDFVGSKEGHESVKVRRRFHAPVWLWPGFDLVMEMMPFYVVNRKEVHLVLPPVDERPEPVYSESL